MMIGQSLPEYIFIRLSIAGLRLIAPLSVPYVALSLYLSWNLVDFLGLYAIAEILFYAFVFVPRRVQLQLTAKDAPRLTRSEREKLFERCAECMTAEATGGWFLPSPNGGETPIRRDNARDWLLWSLFSSTPSDILEEWHEELEYYVTVFSSFVGYPIGRGHNADRRALCLSLDPVVALHRPLLWYMIIALIDCITSIMLFTLDFHHHNIAKWFHAFPPRPVVALFSSDASEPDIPYWYKPHHSKDKSPILFIHGIGIGLWPYLPFLRELIAQDPDVGIIALELLPISSRITSPPLSRPQLCAAITRILDAHGLQRVALAGHSYGTVVSAYILRSPTLRQRIAGVLLVDPIPFLLHHPAVAYNFVYRTPRTANEWQLWFFASRDPDIARALGRHFHWFESVLFKEDVEGLPIGVALAGRDQVIDAEAVRRYLTGEDSPKARWEGEGREVLWFPKDDHAQVFDTREKRAKLLDILGRFVRLKVE